MLRIVTVYNRDPTAEDDERRDLVPLSMSYIRWFRISERLADVRASIKTCNARGRAIGKAGEIRADLHMSVR